MYSFVNILMLGVLIGCMWPSDLMLIDERAWTLCLDSLWNSCVGRCGQSLYGPPYLCACDLLCITYDDCCLDFDYECLYDLNITRNASITRDSVINTGRMSCVGLATTMEYGVLMVSSCATWWPREIGTQDAHNTTKGRCISPNTTSLKPVIGKPLQTIYKNEDCAKCNGVWNYEPWTVVIQCNSTVTSNSGIVKHHHLLPWLYSCQVVLDFEGLNSSNARACAYNMGECPVPASSVESGTSTSLELTDDELSCPEYSKPIMVTNNDQSTVIYKNIHCARCNGHCFNMLFCPQWELHSHKRTTLEMTHTIYFEVGVSADTRGSLPNLPASFSVLFYFNQDGFHMNMFSSQDEHWWDNCDDNQIWDPFWETCRDIYCATKFNSFDYHCIIDDNADSGSPNGIEVINSTYSNITQLENVDVSQVQLVLHLQMDVLVTPEIETILAKEFCKTLAEMLNVTASRFTNYTSLNESFFNGTYTKTEVVSLVVLGQTKVLEPTIEKIVGTLAYAVSLNQIWLQLNSSGYMVKIFGIQEKIIQITNSTSNSTSSSNEWCNDGHQIVYQNSDFTPIVIPYSANNISLHIYVNSTGITYLPGQFIANILMAGPQGSPDVNVSGVAIVCDHSSYNNSCFSVLIEANEYTILPNGSIECCTNKNSSFCGVYQPKDFDILPNGNALLCVDLPAEVITNITDINYHRLINDWRAQSYLTTILLSISSGAIFATIVTYLLFSSLRNVPGWTILNLCFCLLAFQLLYLGGMRFSVYLKRELCKGVAVFLHWTILSSFLWMNAIAFDLYWTFSHLMTVRTAAKSTRKTLYLYAAYSYGLSTAIVGTCLALDLFTELDIGYGEGGWCWIGGFLTLAVAFAGAIGVVLLINFVLYILTVRCIHRMSLKTKAVTGYGASRSRMSIYVRISTVMGFCWALGYLSGISSFSYVVHDIFAYAFIIACCLSGVFIFMAFICNRKAIQLYKNSSFVRWLLRRWAKMVEKKKCKECRQKEDKCSCQKAVARTISNETQQSVVMDDPTLDCADQTNDANGELGNSTD